MKRPNFVFTSVLICPFSIFFLAPCSQKEKVIEKQVIQIQDKVLQEKNDLRTGQQCGRMGCGCWAEDKKTWKSCRLNFEKKIYLLIFLARMFMLLAAMCAT